MMPAYSNVPSGCRTIWKVGLKQLRCHCSKLALSINHTCIAGPSVEWIMWTGHCFAVNGFCFRAVGTLGMGRFRQRFVWQPGCFTEHSLCLCCTQTALRFDALWCEQAGLPQGLCGFCPWHLFSSLLFRHPVLHFSLMVIILFTRDYLSWLISCSKITFVPAPPSSCLPHQHPVVSVLPLSGTSLIRQIHTKEKV